jgi:cephalosporin-C deacetylase-like acetyl esterase
LIAVDEVTKYLEEVLMPNPFGQYWQEVRKEIENL